MRYTHIGLGDQAKAISKLPKVTTHQSPADSALHMRCTQCATDRQSGAGEGTDSQDELSGRAEPKSFDGADLDFIRQALAATDTREEKATPTGLEPATTGSTVQYSNQLSYGAWCSLSMGG